MQRFSTLLLITCSMVGCSRSSPITEEALRSTGWNCFTPPLVYEDGSDNSVDYEFKSDGALETTNGHTDISEFEYSVKDGVLTTAPVEYRPIPGGTHPLVEVIRGDPANATTWKGVIIGKDRLELKSKDTSLQCRSQELAAKERASKESKRTSAVPDRTANSQNVSAREAQSSPQEQHYIVAGGVICVNPNDFFKVNAIEMTRNQYATFPSGCETLGANLPVNIIHSFNGLIQVGNAGGTAYVRPRDLR